MYVVTKNDFGAKRAEHDAKKGSRAAGGNIPHFAAGW
jgi:hypothetical protein